MARDVGVAQDAEGDDGEVDVAGGERLVDDRAVAVEVVGVERQPAHLRPERLERRGGGVEVVGVACRERDGARALAGHRFGDGEADLARAAEDERGLDGAERVAHANGLHEPQAAGQVGLHHTVRVESPPHRSPAFEVRVHGAQQLGTQP